MLRTDEIGPAKMIAFIAMCCVALSACETTEDIMPPRVDPTPLVVDPLEDIGIIGWWLSDRHVLHLQPRGSYVAYAGTTRYGGSVERGRWGRISYAHVTLEPYRILDAATQRWTLTRINGQLAMTRAGETFVWLGEMPHSPEDDVIGVWTSDTQMLTLGSDMRFTWLRSQPASVGSLPLDMRGSWSIADGVITLRSDDKREPAVPIAVHGENEHQRSLITPAGELTDRDS